MEPICLWRSLSEGMKILEENSRELSGQIIAFLKGLELKDEAEDMSGHEELDWEKLKKQLLNRFGSSLPWSNTTDKN